MFLKGKCALVTGSTSGIGLAMPGRWRRGREPGAINGFGDAAAIARERGLRASGAARSMSTPT